MARIRSLHPGQWTDESFVECSAFARLLTLGLRNEADDQGVFEWKPTTLKMRLFPADNVDVSALLDELINTDQVLKFEVGGKPFGAIRNFRKWQRPEKPKIVHELPDSLKEFVGLDSSQECGDLRHSLWEAQKGKCAYCNTVITFYSKKANSLEVDHVIPVSRGGSSERQNLVAACIQCNRSKGDMTGDEYREKRAKTSESTFRNSESGVSLRQSANPTSEEGGRREEVGSNQPIRSDDSEPLLVALSATDENQPQKPEEPDERRKRGRRIAPDWKPSDQDRGFARDAGFTDHDIDNFARDFVDYWIAASGRNAVKLDWSATWRNRIRQIRERRGSRPAPARQERRGVVEIAAELAAEYANRPVSR